MGDILDMNEYRTRQRKLRQLDADAKKASTHPGWDKRKESYDARQEAARAERARGAWAYGPEGLSGGSKDPQPSGGIRKGELTVFATGTGRKPGAARTEAYIEDIVDRAQAGSMWAQFRMAALQCTDMAPGAARESMQLAFPNMDPPMFEIWLDRAAEEFTEYTNILDSE